jgi:hypothetical protein
MRAGLVVTDRPKGDCHQWQEMADGLKTAEAVGKFADRRRRAVVLGEEVVA